MESNNSILEKILIRIRYRRVMMSISHSNYKVAVGGTEKVIIEEQKMFFQNEVSYMHFFPKNYLVNESVLYDNLLLGMTIDTEFIDYYDINQIRAILYVLRKLNMEFLGINIHHTLGINIEILEKMISNISDNIKFFLHDYYSACPQFNFLKNNQVYCGDMPEGESRCLNCIYGEIRKKHLKKYEDFFSKYDITFIAPSQIAKDIWLKTHKDLSYKVRVVPHQIPKGNHRRNSISEEKIKLAYVGYQSINKGWNLWKYIAQNININDYELYHLGECSEKIENVKKVDVSFHREGTDAMINAIKDNNIDIVLLWSIWPETYSFTYFESYAAGAYVITNNISGNIYSQVMKNKNGVVLEDETSVYSFLADKENVLKLLKKFSDMESPLLLETNTELIDEIKKGSE